MNKSKIKQEINNGDKYWTISLMRTGDPVFEDIWIGNSMDINRLKNGIVFKNEIEARTALEEIKIVLNYTNNL